jgi:hypothetical protein
VAIVQYTLTHKQYIEQHSWHKQYIEQHNSPIRKSADRALSLQGIPWHLPYNWGKSTEKPQSGCYCMLSLSKQFPYNLHIHCQCHCHWNFGVWDTESVGWNLVMRMIMWRNLSIWTLTWVLERERIRGVRRIGMMIIIIQSVLRHGFGNFVMVDSQLSLCRSSRFFCCTSSCRCRRSSKWWFTLNLVYQGIMGCDTMQWVSLYQLFYHEDGGTIFLWYCNEKTVFWTAAFNVVGWHRNRQCNDRRGAWSCSPLLLTFWHRSFTLKI